MALVPFSPQASVRSPSSLDLLRLGVEGRTSCAPWSNVLRAEHVVDPAVAAGAHAVVAVVAQGEPRNHGFSRSTSAAACPTGRRPRQKRLGAGHGAASADTIVTVNILIGFIASTFQTGVRCRPAKGRRAVGPPRSASSGFCRRVDPRASLRRDQISARCVLLDRRRTPEATGRGPAIYRGCRSSIGSSVLFGERQAQTERGHLAAANSSARVGSPAFSPRYAVAAVFSLLPCSRIPENAGDLPR